MKIVITGAEGLIGFHAATRLHASNRAALFKSDPAPYEISTLNHASFRDDTALKLALIDAEAVLHFAGVNRAPDDIIKEANPDIARRLADFCAKLGIQPHIVYANSTHAASDTPYGRSKRTAGEILSKIGGKYTDLILPHIFGEGARPRYNNVTATFIEAVIADERPHIEPTGEVALLHAGVAASIAIDSVRNGQTGIIHPDSRITPVIELFKMLQTFHLDYSANIFPDLSDLFTLTLFNSYRLALYPNGFPRSLKLNTDVRGTLFEAVKGGGGGQTFLSTTHAGVTRGNHFHLNKVERFLVIQGEALIRIRKVLTDEIWEYRVSGSSPAPVDMPTMHTHSIENVGSDPLLTLFWTHDLFDPSNSDTYSDPVLKA